MTFIINASEHYFEDIFCEEALFEEHKVHSASLCFDVHHYHDDLYSKFQIQQPDNFHRCRDKRKAEYLAGRICAARCLGASGLHHYQVLTANRNIPHFPVGLVGSVSHTDNFAAVCVADASQFRSIGIDIENIIEASQVNAIEEIVLDADENSLQNQCELPYAHFLTLVFSAKETIYKAVNIITCNFFGFDAVRLNAIKPLKNKLTFRFTRSLGEEFMAGQEITVGYSLQQKRIHTFLFIRQ